LCVCVWVASFSSFLLVRLVVATHTILKLRVLRCQPGLNKITLATQEKKIQAPAFHTKSFNSFFILLCVCFFLPCRCIIDVILVGSYRRFATMWEQLPTHLSINRRFNVHCIWCWCQDSLVASSFWHHPHINAPDFIYLFICIYIYALYVYIIYNAYIYIMYICIYNVYI
jgi:hypothetical protein